MKKGLELDAMIDAKSEPLDTGVPQRGMGTARLRPERRSDQMSVRMTATTRTRIETLARNLDVPIAEVVERAVAAYRPK